MAKKQSRILATVQATAKGLHVADAIDQVAMREFDALNIEPVAPLRPAQIKRIRETSKVSQAVFAALLNTSVSTVQKWEIGQKRPTGTALKLLHLVQKRGLAAQANSTKAPITARTGRDLTRLMELSAEDSATMELRVALLKKIITEVDKQGLTHAQAAERTGTSRSRMTSILNGAIQDVSTDLLLRVLAALGIRARISFAKAG